MYLELKSIYYFHKADSNRTNISLSRIKEIGFPRPIFARFIVISIETAKKSSIFLFFFKNVLDKKICHYPQNASVANQMFRQKYINN